LNSPALDIQADAGLWHWLAAQDISLALTTYQSNRLFFIGRTAEGERLALHERLFDKPMGLFWRDERLSMACRYQIWQLVNRLPPGHSHEGGDRLYCPRRAWITGDLNAHEVVEDRQGRLLFVNTDFSCLATVDAEHNFVPLWQPPFISKLVAEDRCHLNGLALKDGEPTWMTACSQTDEAAGWRHHRHDGGVVLHLPSNAIVARGFSMPHSPRWYRDRLWLLNSGSGELGYLDGERFEPVCYAPGFVRGLAFSGDFAILGLSQLRSSSFGGLALEQRLAADGQQAQCGLMVVDLTQGRVVHWLRFGNLVEELFDVVVIPGCRQPRALGLQEDAIERLVSFPGHTGLMITKPGMRRGRQPAALPVAGLPWPATPAGTAPTTGATPSEAAALQVRYQRVYHLTPDNLLPYDAMTWPRLSARWASQPPRGELVGLSAAIAGEIVGFAIAEQFLAEDGSPRAELISWFVAPEQRRRGIGRGLLARLREQLGGALVMPPGDEERPHEPAPARPILDHAGYRVFDVFGCLTPLEQREVIDFWLEQRLLSSAEAQRRVSEVCVLLRDHSNRLVGVSSLYAGQIADAGQTRAVCFYRTYLQPSARGHRRLSIGMLKTVRALVADSGRCPFGCSAIAFETENRGLMTPALRRLFARLGWRHLGTSPRGRDLWLAEGA